MESPDEAPITRIVQYYYPHFEPPENRKDWNQAICPAHEEDNPSCSINYEIGGIRCMACGFRGNVVSIIRKEENISRAQAKRRATELLGSGYEPVQTKPARKPGRRVFGNAGTEPVERGRKQSAPWLRR